MNAGGGSSSSSAPGGGRPVSPTPAVPLQYSSAMATSSSRDKERDSRRAASPAGGIAMDRTSNGSGGSTAENAPSTAPQTNQYHHPQYPYLPPRIFTPAAGSLTDLGRQAHLHHQQYQQNHQQQQQQQQSPHRPQHETQRARAYSAVSPSSTPAHGGNFNHFFDAEIALWSQTHVLRWLVDRGLGAFATQFSEHHVNGETLISISGLDHLRTMGIAIDDCPRLLSAIRKLRGAPVSISPITPTAPDRSPSSLTPPVVPMRIDAAFGGSAGAIPQTSTSPVHAGSMSAGSVMSSNQLLSSLNLPRPPMGDFDSSVASLSSSVEASQVENSSSNTTRNSPSRLNLHSRQVAPAGIPPLSPLSPGAFSPGVATSYSVSSSTSSASPNIHQMHHHHQLLQLHRPSRSQPELHYSVGPPTFPSAPTAVAHPSNAPSPTHSSASSSSHGKPIPDRTDSISGQQPLQNQHPNSLQQQDRAMGRRMRSSKSHEALSIDASGAAATANVALTPTTAAASFRNLFGLARSKHDHQTSQSHQQMARGPSNSSSNQSRGSSDVLPPSPSKAWASLDARSPPAIVINHNAPVSPTNSGGAGFFPSNWSPTPSSPSSPSHDHSPESVSPRTASLPRRQLTKSFSVDDNAKSAGGPNSPFSPPPPISPSLLQPDSASSLSTSPQRRRPSAPLRLDFVPSAPPAPLPPLALPLSSQEHHGDRTTSLRTAVAAQIKPRVSSLSLQSPNGSGSGGSGSGAASLNSSIPSPTSPSVPAPATSSASSPAVESDKVIPSNKIFDNCIKVTSTGSQSRIIDISKCRSGKEIRELVLHKFWISTPEWASYALYGLNVAGDLDISSPIDDDSLLEICRSPNVNLKTNLILNTRSNAAEKELPMVPSESLSGAPPAPIPDSVPHLSVNGPDRSSSRSMSVSSSGSTGTRVRRSSRKSGNSSGLPAPRFSSLRKPSSPCSNADADSTSAAGNFITRAQSMPRRLSKHIMATSSSNLPEVFFGERPPSELICENLEVFFPSLARDSVPSMSGIDIPARSKSEPHDFGVAAGIVSTSAASSIAPSDLSSNTSGDSFAFGAPASDIASFGNDVIEAMKNRRLSRSASQKTSFGRRRTSGEPKREAIDNDNAQRASTLGRFADNHMYKKLDRPLSVREEWKDRLALLGTSGGLFLSSEDPGWTPEQKKAARRRSLRLMAPVITSTFPIEGPGVVRSSSSSLRNNFAAIPEDDQAVTPTTESVAADADREKQRLRREDLRSRLKMRWRNSAAEALRRIQKQIEEGASDDEDGIGKLKADREDREDDESVVTPTASSAAVKLEAKMDGLAVDAEHKAIDLGELLDGIFESSDNGDDIEHISRTLTWKGFVPKPIDLPRAKTSPASSLNRSARSRRSRKADSTAERPLSIRSQASSVSVSMADSSLMRDDLSLVDDQSSMSSQSSSIDPQNIRKKSVTDQSGSDVADVDGEQNQRQVEPQAAPAAEYAETEGTSQETSHTPKPRPLSIKTAPTFVIHEPEGNSGTVDSDVTESVGATFGSSDMPIFTPDDELPTHIEWIKGDLIGKGSFGRVYFGVNLTTKEVMAVKQVEMIPLPVRRGPGVGSPAASPLTPPSSGVSPVSPVPPSSSSSAESSLRQKMVDALRMEILLLRELDHENVVQYLGFDVEMNTISVFLQYVDGGSVASMLSRYGNFEEGLVQSITCQILCGLDYLHERSIIHRDIKGANILISHDGVAKISDFGISKKNECKKAYRLNSRMSLQGSVYWMAPEVIKAKGYSAKVDIWSLGCVTLEMFSGNHPWRQLDEMQTMWRLGKENAPPIPDTVGTLGAEFLAKCFTIEPDLRPTAAELLFHPFADIDPKDFDFKSCMRRMEEKRLQDMVEETSESDYDDSDYEDEDELEQYDDADGGH